MRVWAWRLSELGTTFSDVPRSRKGERLCLNPLRSQGYGAKRLPINVVEMDCKSSKAPPHHSHEEEVLGA